MNQQQTLVEYTLRLGDSALILGHRLSEWMTNAPQLEEDIALANIALDCIGQARMFLSYAGEVENAGRDENALAYHRDAKDWRNVLLVEQTNGDFAFTIARQFLFDAFQFEFYSTLSNSKDETLAAIAQKAVKEVTYHRRHSGNWFIRLGDGTDESHTRMQRALDSAWPFTDELFEMDEVDNILLASHIAVNLEKLKSRWNKHVDSVFAQAFVTKPAEIEMQSGGKTGQHGEALKTLLADMQSLARTHPEASW